VKNNAARVDVMTQAYIKSLTLEEIEDLLRDNMTLEELEAEGILPKKSGRKQEARE
jgi:hypothetical protein